MRSIEAVVCCLISVALMTGCAGTQKCAPSVQGAVPTKAAAEEGPLVLDGTPEIPLDLKERLQPYLNTRRAFVGDISADGGRMLVNTRFGETSQVHLLASPLGAREQISFLPEPVRSPSFVPGRTDQVAFVTDRGGNEVYQLFLLNLDDRSTRALSPEKGRVSRYEWWSGGSLVAFNNNARDGRNMDIYVADISTDSPPVKIADANGHWFPMAWSDDGKQLLVGEYISIQESKLHLIDVATGSVRQLTPDQPVASYKAAVFSRGGEALFVITDRAGDFNQIMQLELDSGRLQPVGEAHPWNVENLDLSSDGSELVYSINEGGYSRAFLYDVSTEKTEAIEAIPDGIIYGVRFARDARRFAFTLATPVTEFDAYTYDLEEKKTTRWTRSEMGGLRSENFTAPQLIHFESFDGRQIPAFYYRPKGEGPFPVVVRIHGGPESQSRPYFTPYVQYLVGEKKVAVVVPNVRGSDGYGKTYLGLDNGMQREDSVKDIGALLDWIAAAEELDEQRVGVVGGSYGGYMVLASLMHYPDRIAAGVDVVGISSFITFLENTKDYRRDLRRAEYGDERDPQMRAFFERIDPINNVEKISSPLLVAQGANDPRVPASEAEQIVAAVRASGREVWYMLAKNEGHGFRKKTNKDTYLYLMLLFLEQHLLP